MKEKFRFETKAVLVGCFVNRGLINFISFSTYSTINGPTDFAQLFQDKMFAELTSVSTLRFLIP